MEYEDTQIESLDGIVEPPSWRQLGVFVMDGSGSMGPPGGGIDHYPTKASAVNSTLRELIGRFARSDKKANFAFGFISFHSSVSHVSDVQEAMSIDGSEQYDPTNHGTGGTKIASGLEAAEQMVEAWEQREAGSQLPLSVVVMVMSDGETSDPEAAVEIASRLKSRGNVTVVSTLFAGKGASGAGGVLLERLATGPEYYKRSWDTEQLRKFFMASMTMATAAAHGEPEEFL